MSSISLLVDCHKIINWLEDRKKLRKDWYNYLKAAEEKLKTLLRSRDWAVAYPSVHEYINANEQNFNYNDVANTVELMLKTNLAEKNMLFGYSNKVMKEWNTLKRYMDGNCINLLSVAKFIEQSLRFDLPALNKSIETLDNQLGTLKRKIDYNQNTIYQQLTALEKEKVLLGVDTEAEQQMNIEQIIQALIRKGPQQFIKLEQMCKTSQMQKCLQVYSLSAQYNQTPNDLQTLKYFTEKGNEFLSIYRDEFQREKYLNANKYEQYQCWKGSNEWDIEIQGLQKQQSECLDRTTILQDRQIRQQLLYNLNQLLFFFKGLRFEINSAAKGLGFQTQNNKGFSLVEGDAEQAVKTIEDILAFLSSKRLTAPLELKNSRKAYQVLVRQFSGYEANISAMKRQIAAYLQQISEQELKRQEEVRKLKRLRTKVISSKAKCEAWISELVNKEVKINGQINKLE